MPVRIRSGRMMKEEITTKRARMVKKSKTGWFDLPFEMREMIIDEMDEKTRCIFAMCSKLCEKEVKESNNYLYSIHVSSSNDYSSVRFSYNRILKIDNHTVYFKKIDNSRSFAEHENDVEIIVDGNLEETTASFVQENIEKYGKSLRKLYIHGEDFNAYLSKINFNMIRKLENIEMRFDNVLEVSDDTNRIIGLDKILRAKYIKMPQFNFTFDQIIKFEGIEAKIGSIDMNEENVNKYLKMLKNGEVRRNIEKMTIYVDYENDVDFMNIIEGLNPRNFVSSESGCSFEMRSKINENELGIIWVEYDPSERLTITF